MDKLNLDGFLHLKNILELDIIDNIINDIIKCIKKYNDYYNIYYDNSSDKLELLYSMLYNLYDLDKNLYFNFIKQNGILSNLFEIKSLFTNKKIIDILNKLGYNNLSIPITTQVNFYSDFATNTEYRNGTIGIDSHQDWPQSRGSINSLSVWIPLMDINENNCPLLVIPKSNHDGFINGNKNSLNIVVDKYSEDKFENVLMDKGDCILFNGWIVHKTGLFKNNEKIRIALVLRYNDLNDNYFISNQYYISYNTTTNKNIEQSRIPYNDEILKYFGNTKVEHYADLYNKRKFWYNNYGKLIENNYEKLLKLHRYIKCNDLSKELIEQLLMLKYLNENAKVLELGGNIGRVSLIIATILINDKNLVVIEPTKDIAQLNIKNRNINCFNYNVETNIISNKPLYLKKNNIESVANKIINNNIDDDCELIENITFNELEIKYNIIFDTLIIDCEGSFYQILLDEPNILKNINTIIIENDFEKIEEYNYIYNSFINNGFILIDTNSCYPINANGICEKYMHQVFKKNVL